MCIWGNHALLVSARMQLFMNFVLLIYFSTCSLVVVCIGILDWFHGFFVCLYQVIQLCYHVSHVCSFWFLIVTSSLDNLSPLKFLIVEEVQCKCKQVTKSFFSFLFSLYGSLCSKKNCYFTNSNVFSSTWNWY